MNSKTHKMAFVIGNPIEHSLSPVIHNHWIDQCNISAKYEKRKLEASECKNFFNKEKWQNENIVGCNVTIPYKISCMQHLDIIDDMATSMGAVNTVYMRDKLLHGTNTDMYGLLHNLTLQQPQALHNTQTKTAVILGAGGAACAAIYALLTVKYKKIMVIARSAEKAYAVIGKMPDVYPHSQISVHEWEQHQDVLPHAHLLINCTSAGMQGQSTLDIPITAMPKEAVIYDIIFKPLETDLILEAKKHGYAYVTGLGMLIHQAAPAFEHFFGVLPDITPSLLRCVEKKAREAQ